MPSIYPIWPEVVVGRIYFSSIQRSSLIWRFYQTFTTSNSKENHPIFEKTIWTLVGKMKKFEFFLVVVPDCTIYYFQNLHVWQRLARSEDEKKKNWEREMDERDAWRLKTLKRWTCAISLNAKIYKIHAQKVHVVLNRKCLYICTRGPCLHRLKHSTLLFFMPISLAEHLAVLIYSHYVCVCVSTYLQIQFVYTQTHAIYKIQYIYGDR